MDNKGRAAVANELFNRLTFLLFIMVAVANQQKIPGVIGHLLDSFNHCPKEWIGHISHHQTDGLCGLLCQRTRIGVGVVAE